MEFTPQQKEELEQKIVDIITSSLEKDKIKEEDLSNISTYVLENIDKVTTKTELNEFLKNLSLKWPIFQGLSDIEQGEVKEEQEKKVIENVENLVESGNIDQALAAAKAATQQ